MRGNKHVPPTHTHLPPTVLDTHTLSLFLVLVLLHELCSSSTFLVTCTTSNAALPLRLCTVPPILLLALRPAGLSTSATVEVAAFQVGGRHPTSRVYVPRAPISRSLLMLCALPCRPPDWLHDHEL